jgi:hypothetical protein
MNGWGFSCRIFHHGWDSGGLLRERLKRLEKLRQAWEQRKRATELRMSTITAKLSAARSDEEYVVSCLEGSAGQVRLFPDILTQRLAKISKQKEQKNRELESVRAIHYQDSLNLRRCEILEKKQRTEMKLKDEAAALADTIDVFLASKYMAK